MNVEDLFKFDGTTPRARNAYKKADGSVAVPLSVFFGQFAGNAPPPQPNALKRGALTVKSDMAAAAGLVAQAVGMDEAANNFYQRAQEISEERDLIPRRVGRIEDIHGPGDFGVFAIESLLENAPLLATIAIPGMSAAKVAGFAGRAAVMRGATTVGALARTKNVVGASASFLTDLALQTGESAEIAREAGGDPLDTRVVGAGLGKAALDFVPIMFLARQVGLLRGSGIADTIERNLAGELIDKGFVRFAKRAGKNVATLVASEVPAEVTQEIINIALDRSFQQHTGELTAEEKSQLYNAAAGAATFGLLGIPAAVFNPGAKITPATDEDLNPKLLPPPPPSEEPPRGGGFGPGPSPRRGGPIAEYQGPAPLEGEYIPYEAPKLPPAQRITIDGEVVPSGYLYNPSEDKLLTGTSLARSIKAQLGRDEQPKLPTTRLLTSQGVEHPNQQDPLTAVATELGSIPPIYRVPETEAVIQVENKRAATIQNDTFELIGEAAANYPVVIQTLMQARDDVYLNPERFRSADGAITKQAQKLIDTIDKHIARWSQKLGIDNPVTGQRTYTIENPEVELQILNKQEAERPRADEKLSATESALLDRLEAKDYAEGLSQREEDTRERLIAKRQGEITAERQKVSAAERKELRSLGAEIGDEESIQVYKREDTETMEFKNWFRESKVTFEDGTPRPVYHGSFNKFEAFDKKKRGSATGSMSSFGGFFFASNPETSKSYISKPVRKVNAGLKVQRRAVKRIEAITGVPRFYAARNWDNGMYSSHPQKDEIKRLLDTLQKVESLFEDMSDSVGSADIVDPHPKGRMYKVYLSLKNPLIVEEPVEGYGPSMGFLIAQAKHEGHDGLIIKNTRDSLLSIHDENDPETDVYVAFEPEQIKSTDNRGTYDPNDPNMYKRAGGKTKKKGLSIAEVTAFITEFVKGFKLRPEIVVANSGDKGAFPDGSQRRADITGDSRGAFFADDPNSIYIFADKHSTLEEVAETVLHEMGAHYGLRAYLDPAALTKLLKGIYASRYEMFQKKHGVAATDLEAMQQAEEYIAEIAENGTDMPILQRVIAAIRAAFRKIIPSLKMSDNDIRALLKDINSFMRGGVPGRNPGGIMAHFSEAVYLRTIGEEVGEDILPQVESFRKVWGAKFGNWFLSPLQMAAQYNIPGAMKYMDFVQAWNARRGNLTRRAAELAETWMKMAKKEANAVASMLFEVSETSDILRRRLTTEELMVLAKKHDVSKVAYKLFEDIDKTFIQITETLQASLSKAAIRHAMRGKPNAQAETERLYKLWMADATKDGRKVFMDMVVNDPSLKHFNLGSRLAKIENDMQILRNRHYFPRMRFGQYSAVIRAKQAMNYDGKAYAADEVIYYETFENYKAREKRMVELRAQHPKERFEIFTGKVKDEEFSLLGMPPALYEELEDTLGLTEAQKDALKDLYFKYSPGRAFLRHLTKRKGINGYSRDAMRVYASYMMNAANHIARVEFNEDMNEQLKVMETAALRSTTQYGEVSQYFHEHFQYLMNPKEDLAKYRAMGFLWYLGFNVKSALVNLTQVPMVAYPFLAAHYGDGAAIAAIGRAYKSVSLSLTGRKAYDPETDKAVQQGIAEKFLDESFATELAGLGESSTLQRMLPIDEKWRMLDQVAYYGSFLFKHAEKYNREVVFLAARELALQKRPGDYEYAFKAGRKAVQASMFEYNKWNRPVFSRGKKSIFFLFWQYMQHLAYMAYGGEGKGAALRVWMMLLVVAGLQGLPFAENFFDIFDFGSREFQELVGSKNPYSDIRADIRELALNIHDNPDIIMHGLSRYYGLGPLHLMAMMGAPIPYVDISGSLSAGRPIPGTDALLGEEKDPNAQFGRAMAEMLGPVVGVGYNMWKSMESEDPNLWKVWERAMPTTLANASKAARRGVYGEESFRGGGAVAEFNPYNDEDFTELMAQFFGFATTRVNQKFEQRASQERMKMYWATRRTKVLENYAYAVMSHDQEAIADARKALVRFNQQAPQPSLRIRAETVQQSLRERFRRADLREDGIPSERAMRSIYMDKARLHPVDPGQETAEGLPVP